MTQVKIVTLKTLFNNMLKGEEATSVLQKEFADYLKEYCKNHDDKAMLAACRVALRTECGLPEKAPKRPTVDGKQVAKSRAENAFDVLFHRATNIAWPKAKPGPVDKKGNAKEADKAKGAEKAQGITHRTQAYALVLQDLAACKTAGGMANSEITALAKLLPKLHDWATLEK